MKHVSFLIMISLVLAACSSPQVAPANPAQPVPAVTLTSTQAVPAASEAPVSTAGSTASPDLLRIDEQGAIVVEVTPVNLANPGETLEFEVVLTTHSVDLSMDLAPLATLTTDTGQTVQASLWDAPRGGHHVSGKLIFPASVAGQPLLQGASLLTLKIVNLEAVERTFTWDL